VGVFDNAEADGLGLLRLSFKDSKLAISVGIKNTSLVAGFLTRPHGSNKSFGKRTPVAEHNLIGLASMFAHGLSASFSFSIPLRDGFVDFWYSRA
jgi:hypothetical protein